MALIGLPKIPTEDWPSLPQSCVVRLNQNLFSLEPFTVSHPSGNQIFAVDHARHDFDVVQRGFFALDAQVHVTTCNPFKYVN